MIVMKFGGTSVGSAERIANVASLVAQVEGPKALVVSAMGGTTDQLLEAATLAEAGDEPGAVGILDRIAERHRGVASEPEVSVEVDALLAELRSLLHGVFLLRETTARTRAVLVSFGERLCVPLMAQQLRSEGLDAYAVDARTLVRTDDRHDEAAVDMATTTKRCKAFLSKPIAAGRVPVITGFIGSTPDGITTTLGRSGSDYSAAIFGACLDAAEVWIWTDVDGILTADPRLVSEARTLERVSYREAAEMSYFGAKVLHPRTMGPCADKQIPIRIRSTFHPDRVGTVVAAETADVDDGHEGVKTVTSIEGMAPRPRTPSRPPRRRVPMS